MSTNISTNMGTNIGTNMITQNKDYDHIIVSARSAGCVISNRLSKNPKIKVLLYKLVVKTITFGFISPRDIFTAWVTPAQTGGLKRLSKKV